MADISISNLKEALTFIRRAACDATITDSVSITNRSLDELTPDEAKALLAANGIEVRDGLNIKFVVDNADTMHVRIPYFGNIQKYPDGQTDPTAGDKPGAGGDKLPSAMKDYEFIIPELKDIYAKNYADSDDSNPYEGGPEDVVELNNARLVDYALSQCR